MKRSHFDRALDALKQERAVLDLAIAKLEAQQAPAPKPRKPKAVAVMAGQKSYPVQGAV